MSEFKRRLVVGISGSSGAIYGIRVLEALRAEGDTEIHLVLTEAARRTIALETEYAIEKVAALAHMIHDNQDLAASISSGSFPTDGMIIAPCSMRTLGEISHAIASSLLARAADVHLKERRRLILMVRETPLHLIHLRNMAAVVEAGAIVLPPIPAFYHHPRTVEDIVNQSVGKALDLLSIPHRLFIRWQNPRV